MKKIDRDPFSNGTEFMIWEENNCDKCVKSSRIKKTERGDEYTKVRCAIQRDIFTRMVGSDPISVRTIDICRTGKCPFKQERYKKHKKYEKFKNEPKLFEI